jgi:asparagine synthase (glutamine-hydrolysing)
MAARGIRVSINGAAGDELFGGYPGIYYLPYLAALVERGELGRLHREITRFSEQPAAAGSRLYWSRLVQALLHSLKHRRIGREAAVRLRQRRGRGQAILASTPSPVTEPMLSLEPLMRAKATDWLMSYWLRSGHQNYMGVPVEVRAPFLDHRVVESALSLPVTYAIRDGWLKWILRQAADGVLPKAVTYRAAKMGFPFPMERWLDTNRDSFFAAIRGSDPCPYIDQGALRHGYDDLARRDPMMLWRAMSVCLWWRRCVVGEPLAA